VNSPIKVLLVDDHFVVRKGVCALLADAEDIEVVGEAGDGRQAVEEAARCSPQVILMDLNLPEVDGVEATRTILAAQPEVKIVILTSAEIEEGVLSAVKAGALGYLAKTSQRQEFLDAIREVSRGEAWLPPRLTRKLLAHLQTPAADAVTLDTLTGREGEVLGLLAHGWSNRRIAGELSIAEVTVRTHVSHVLDKLGVSNRVEAALHALRLGLAAPGPP
jgi:DNA-binding NarL/FixJ family response regulator